jgi:outer membrane protein assembly factor BamD (BamD/ComL family)
MKTKSDRRDMAVRIMADYYFSRGNMEKAREWYQTILLDFPNSFYIETARSRLRQIRGDNL